MYKAAVRWMIRRNIAKLNAGDYGPALAMYADDVEFSFPGDNSWADEFRPRRARPARPRDAPRPGRDGAVPAALRRRRDPDGGRGHPRQRAAVEPARRRPGATSGRRAQPATATPTGPSCSSPRRWGKLRTQEDYEDTERAAAFDALLAAERSVAVGAGGDL